MKKILLIEDEKELARLTKIRLGSAGYEVSVASDGKAGLEKVASFKPDLIILDLVIPKVDGYRVCEIIKSDAKYKHIPIIMLTVRAQTIEKKAGYAVGTDEYLTKPYDADLLLNKVNKLLNKSK